MNEYLYISDRKVDCYSAQIPPGVAQSLSAEITASLGVLSTKLKTKDPRTDRVTKVQLVSEFIRKHYPIGSLVNHEPNRGWVFDRLRVRHVGIPTVPSILFLVGISTNREVCALIGSTTHVLGNNSGEPVKFSASYFPHFVDSISAAMEATAKELIYDDLWGEESKVFTGNSDDEVAGILNRFQSDASGYQFQVEFLAKSVYFGGKQRDSRARTRLVRFG